MAFMDNWVVGKEKVCYWMSNDIVGLVALAKGGWVLLIGNNGFCELLIGGNMATISGDD